MQHCLWFLG